MNRGILKIETILSGREKRLADFGLLFFTLILIIPLLIGVIYALPVGDDFNTASAIRELSKSKNIFAAAWSRTITLVLVSKWVGKDYIANKPVSLTSLLLW